MIKNIQIVNTNSIRDAMALLEKNIEKCLIVVDKKNRFYSTLTDGDIRRYFISNPQISDVSSLKINKMINKSPFTVLYSDTVEVILEKLRALGNKKLNFIVVTK